MRTLCLLLLVLPCLSARAQEIPFDAFTLDNGLHVMFHEDHDLPLVTVNIIYRYGSLDEIPGQTGYAHLAEHLMFMGTDRVPGGSFDEIMEAGGGWNNAGTGDDYTVYYDVGPASMLPTLLWLEADRLERIGLDMDQQKLDLQRDVVRNERRQNYEVAPYGGAWLTLPEQMFPEGHPYAHAGIGSHEDLIASTVEDFQQIYATGYAPSNASMVIAGDFDPVATRQLVEQLFGDIPGGERLARPQPRPTALEAPKRIVLEDQVEIPRLLMAWHSPAFYQPGDAELDLLGSILDEEKVGRLERSLVLEQEIAQWVSAFQGSGLLSSVFMIMADAREGVSIDRLESAIGEEMDQLLSEGPTEQELERVRSGWEATFVSGLESLDDRASLLNNYWLFTGDPAYLERDMARYREPTVEDLHEVARTVFVPERLTLWIVPEGEAEAWIADGVAEAAREDGGTEDVERTSEVGERTSEVGERTSEVGETEGQGQGQGEEGEQETVADAPRTARDLRPADLPWKNFVPPAPEVLTLSNGLEVWYLPRDTVPALAIGLVVPAGSAWDPPGKAGLAELTADLMDEGAGKLDATGLAEALSMQGAGVSTHADSESLIVASWMLTRTAPDVLPLVFDVVSKPRLRAGDFDRVQWQTLSHLTQRTQNPASVASVVGWRRFFGDGHPYSWPDAGYHESVGSMKLRDARGFYKQRVCPEGAVLVVVGDVGDTTVQELLEPTFGSWKGPAARTDHPHFPDPEHQATSGVRIFVVDRPGSPQTAIRVVLPGVRAGAEHRLERDLVNNVLGGSFTSRLMRNLREEKGWTYGVRSYPVRFRKDGGIVVRTSMQTEHTAAAVGEIVTEISTLAEGGLTGDEALKAVRSFQQDAVETYGSISSLTRELGSMVDEQLPASAITDRLARAVEADVESLSSRAASMYLPHEATIVLVGDAEVLLPQLEAQGLPDPVLCDLEGSPSP